MKLNSNNKTKCIDTSDQFPKWYLHGYAYYANF